MERVIVTREKLVAVADAIRTKIGLTDFLTLDDMPNTIESIKGGISIEEITNKTLKECVNDSITKIGDYAFYDFRSLSVIRLPNVESIGTGSFTRCTGLKELNFPKCKTIGSQSFTSCNGVLAINMPMLESVPQGAFNSITRLSEINFPVMKKIETQGFYFCSSLERAEFGQLESIGQHGFNQTKISALIIRAGAVCALVNANAFLNSPVVRGEGYIYVPKALVDSYKVATNWTAYASQIRAIEDWPEITGG